jgi:hypothetical protein
MNLNTKQQVHMKNVQIANIAWRDVKRDAAARAKLIAAEEVSGYQAAMDHQIRVAYESGISKLRLRTEGLISKDSKGLEASLARTAPAAAALANKLIRDPYAGRYRWDAEAERIVVTLTDQVFADALKLQEFDITPAVAEKAGLNTALFEVRTRADGSQFIASETAIWMPEYLNSHPVVAWANGPANDAEMFAWYEKEVVA